MFRGLVLFGRKVFADLSRHRTPGGMAAGMALGTSLGFMPVDNLVWVMLLLSVLFLPVHPCSAAMAWGFVAVAGNFLAFIPDAIGEWLLSWEWVRWGVVHSYSVPLGAWLRLNNTMVLGSLATGTSMMVPHWVLGGLRASRTQRSVPSTFFDDLSHVAAMYRKTSSKTVLISPSERGMPVPVDTACDAAAPAAVAACGVDAPAAVAACGALPEKRVLEAGGATETKRLRVDSIPIGIEGLVAVDDQHDERIMLRETFIEVVRLRATEPRLPSPGILSKNDMLLDTQTAAASTPDPSTNIAPQGSPAGAASDSMVTRYSSPHQQLSGPKSSSGLRFLLQHLATHRGSQEQSESRA